MKNKAFLALFSIVFLIPGCKQVIQKPMTRRFDTRNKSLPSQKPIETALDVQEPKEKLPSITIWVHGTRILPDGMFEHFFFSQPGLNHYTSITSDYHQRRLAQTLIDADPIMFPAEHFYLFGWNGKLSFKEREMAARKLYLDLKVVREEYKKKYGVEPVIRMIAHSHGGNIILLLAQVKDPEDTSFFISQAILLATPVQKQTKNYACAECFGKIYSLYSMLDILQVIDPQGLQQKETHALFSERFFPHHEKIEQVAMKINNRSMMHIEFVRKKFMAQIPSILTEIDSWQQSSRLSAHDWSKKDKCLCINTKRKHGNMI
jgi:hypothetical protein